MLASLVIDAHHHFWHYNPLEYGWINASMAVLRRDYLPADLRVVATSAAIDGVISVQARQTTAETDWLLALAEQQDNAGFIRGVVGWVPLVSDRVEAELDRLIDRKKLVAVRHVLQDESDAYMAREDFNHGLSSLRRFGLRYDILIYERQLPAAIAMVDRHPQQIFILDHLAKPRIKDGALSPWRENIRELGRRPNVYCKISGLVTEADHRAWTPAQFEPYVETALEAFGPRRLMIGSDWPVCLLACDYVRWHTVARGFIAKLSAAEQGRILGQTALEAYGIAGS
jgi:L-fucono-1,5-lactonase